MDRLKFIKISSLTASGLAFGNSLGAANLYSQIGKKKIRNIDRPVKEKNWFSEKKFGMFVHWGLYAVPAVHEQYQQRYGISRKQYGQLANQWNPKDFDPEKWLDLMQNAGMEYLTFTTKHHDGFCMWNTKQTAFNVVNTPYKQDILEKLANACHKRNIPLSLYYSIVDWHHPNYPNKGRHHELPKPEPRDAPNWNLYIRFLKEQVRELCTNYGEIHGFWWDMNVPEHKDPSINAMIRKLQPSVMINNRGFDEGDFGTPERDYDPGSLNAKEFTRPTEACQSVGMQSWGYRKDDDYYADRYLKKSIDSYLSRDANYLLNVGPNAKGVIPEVQANTLKRLGKWYSPVRESYKNVEPVVGLVQNPAILLTQRDTILYIHLNKLPRGNSVNLKPIITMPIEAILLNTGQKIECTVERVPYEREPFLFIKNLPVNEYSNEVLVVKLTFENAIK